MDRSHSWPSASVLKTDERKFRGFESHPLRHWRDRIVGLVRRSGKSVDVSLGSSNLPLSAIMISYTHLGFYKIEFHGTLDKIKDHAVL